MQTECSAALFDFAALGHRRVVGDFDGGAITSDGGALLLGRAERVLNPVVRFAGCFGDMRRADLIEHTVETLVGQRV